MQKDSPKTRPLVVISSRTGNTMAVGHAICDALPGAVMVKPDALPEDLTGFNPVLLGFWNDCNDAPDDIKAAAAKLNHKTIGCFATMGGDPKADWAKAWMQDISQTLVNLGKGNTLSKTFLCRGRIDPAVLTEMTRLLGGDAGQASATHPDRLDLSKAAEFFRGAFGANW